MNETELKPCPFCGGKAELKKEVSCWGHGMYISEHYVSCASCGGKSAVEPEYTQTKEECITKCTEAWNRRAENEQRETDRS